MFQVVIAFVLGLLFGAAGVLLWYDKEYNKLMNDVDEMEREIARLVKRVEEAIREVEGE